MRLAHIDDHPTTIDGVGLCTSRMAQPPAIDGYTSMEAFARAYSEGASYDLALLDLKIPGYSDLAALNHFRKTYPMIPVVVLSANDDPAVIRAALEQSNAMGYIPKSEDGQVLLGALELVLKGGVYVPPQIIHYLPGPPPSLPETEGTPRPGGASFIDDRKARARADILARLTPRQREVLNLLLKGYSDKLINRELDISNNTLKVHKRAIFATLDVDSRVKAVLVAQRLEMLVGYGDARLR